MRAGIAHDFNNILGAILGYGELAQQQSPKDSAVRRYIDHVMHAANRAKSLVDRILGFSRSGMGERVPVNVEDVVAETLELLEASTPAGIRIEARLAAHDAAIIGDATYLHQVAMNLCTNALQAMPHGGVLHVELDAVDLDAPKTISRGSARGRVAMCGSWCATAAPEFRPESSSACSIRFSRPSASAKARGSGFRSCMGS